MSWKMTGARPMKYPESPSLSRDIFTQKQPWPVACSVDPRRLAPIALRYLQRNRKRVRRCPCMICLKGKADLFFAIKQIVMAKYSVN
jgi:hypothetical protein